MIEQVDHTIKRVGAYDRAVDQTVERVWSYDRLAAIQARMGDLEPGWGSIVTHTLSGERADDGQPMTGNPPLVTGATA